MTARTFQAHLRVFRAGLAVARHAHLLVLPCDVPQIDAQLLAELRGTAQQNPLLPLMVRHGDFWEPLLCVIPTHLRDRFEQAWQAGERSPRQIMQALGAKALECPANDPRLANLNTPELLHRRPSVSECASHKGLCGCCTRHKVSTQKSILSETNS